VIGKGQWRGFVWDTGVTPLFFTRSGINDHREEGPQLKVTSKN